MATNDTNGSYPNHQDPGPKPTSVGGDAKFTPIGTYQPLSQTPNSVNNKSDYGTNGKAK